MKRNNIKKIHPHKCKGHTRGKKIESALIQGLHDLSKKLIVIILTAVAIVI